MNNEIAKAEFQKHDRVRVLLKHSYHRMTIHPPPLLCATALQLLLPLFLFLFLFLTGKFPLHRLRHLPQRLKLPIIHVPPVPNIPHRAPPLYPNRPNPQLPRRPMIMKLALRRLQHLRLLDPKRVPHRLEHVLEVRVVRFVRPDILRRDHRVKRNPRERSRVAGPERISVDVREHDQLVELGEAVQCVHGVGERRPRADGLAEC